MKKSGDEVLNDLYPLLAESELIGMITGNLYPDGTMRPADSALEDAVLAFKSGTNGQIQEGAVTLNIYVPDIDNGSGGRMKHFERTLAISRKAIELFDQKVLGPYLFSFGNMVQTFPEEALGQHVVSIDLRFKITTFY